MWIKGIVECFVLYISQTVATQTKCMAYLGVGTVVPCIGKSMTCEWDYLNSMNVLHSQSMMHRSAIGVMATCSAYRVYTHRHTHRYTHTRTHTHNTHTLIASFVGGTTFTHGLQCITPHGSTRAFLWVCSFNDALLL